MARGLGPALVAELIGTFLFFFIGAGSALLPGADLVTIALAHGLILTALVSAFGAVSGAHFNPAVTTGLWVLGKVKPAQAGAYIVVQLIAAAAAGIVLLYVFSNVTAAVPALRIDTDVVKGIVIEALLASMLVFTVIGTAVDRRGPRIGGLAIGFAITAAILMAGPITGAAINPARWFGLAVAAGEFTNFYVWVIGPVLGGVVAALVYRFVFWTDES